MANRDDDRLWLLIAILVVVIVAALSNPPTNISDDVGICNQPRSQMSC